MKKFIAVSLAAMMLLSMSACGGKTEEAPAEEAPVEVTEGAEGAEEAAPAMTKLVVGMECNYAPFNWTQVEENEHTVSLGGAGYTDGYDVQISRYLADQLGVELEIKKIEWTGLEPALNAGEIDAIIAGMTDTPERRQGADFTTPYYESEMVCIVRADDALVNATSLQDFAGKKVLGQLNTIYDEVIDQIPDVDHKTPLATYPLMVVALQSGDADALTAELPVATGVVAGNPELAIVKFEEGKGFVADTSVSIAVKKGNTELLEKLQTALDTISPEQRLEWMTTAVEHQPDLD